MFEIFFFEMRTCNGVMNFAALTCVGQTSQPVYFSDGCGGFDVSTTRWITGLTGASCACTRSAGGVFSDYNGAVTTADQCAQLVCAGGAFMFSTCSWNGQVVATRLVLLQLDFETLNKCCLLQHVEREHCNGPAPVRRHHLHSTAGNSASHTTGTKL